MMDMSNNAPSSGHGRHKTMQPAESSYLTYRRANFAAHLPTRFRYSRSHYWLEPLEGGLWRVGLTRFATRMLGEMVDFGFSIQAGETVEVGHIIGWLEGFKATSDIYSPASGRFVRINPALEEKISLINHDPHGDGWLFEVHGQPDSRCIGAEEYRQHLDVTIDRILSKRGPGVAAPDGEGEK
jgi:glycine cleavage system H protein